jgi:5-methylcytosine-specific restriction endonuclease McrA
MKPTAEQQLQFLQHLQRLFEEGDFVATYKYALLMSLAELAVESGVDEGELELPMIRVAEKFAELYWPQTLPYISGAPGASAALLAQNQGKQAAVVNALSTLRQKGAVTIPQAMRLPDWATTIRSIARTVAAMPVKYLQNVGTIQVSFLYDYPNPRGQIVLKHGVAFMLRVFHPLIQQLSRSGWVRHVRENTRNDFVIGQADALESFMFGSSRNALAAAAAVLVKMQSGKCFYCGKTISSTGDVDHFIPWSKYPRDLAHNFVLACPECNRRKSDMLGAEQHLNHWMERNRRYGSDITGEIKGFLADSDCSNRVARWAYEQGISSQAHGWVEKRITELLTIRCIEALKSSVHSDI